MTIEFGKLSKRLGKLQPNLGSGHGREIMRELEEKELFGVLCICNPWPRLLLRKSREDVGKLVEELPRLILARLMRSDSLEQTSEIQLRQPCQVEIEGSRWRKCISLCWQ